MSVKKESESIRVLRVRGLGWNQRVSTEEYTLGAAEQIKNLSAAKRYTKDFQEIYYAEIVDTEITKTVRVHRVAVE